MSVVFFNVKTGEKRKCSTEPMIAAHYNSSNLHVNAMKQGQDFGWRLAPETVDRILTIKNDQSKVNTIAAALNKLSENISDTDIIFWISQEDARKESLSLQEAEEDYEQAYEKELRDIKKKHKSDDSSANLGQVRKPSPDELKEQAVALGLNPDDYKTKAKLSEAIDAKMKEQ